MVSPVERIPPRTSITGTSRVNTFPPRDEGGFTFVELLFVIMIAALALALVGTSISGSISGAEMRNAARKVTASLRYTRTKAILSKSEQVFHIDPENGQYVAADREPVILPEGMSVELNTARSELTSETAGGIRFKINTTDNAVTLTAQ